MTLLPVEHGVVGPERLVEAEGVEVDVGVASVATARWASTRRAAATCEGP